MTMKIGALLTHPIQYYSPWLTELARASELKVYYAHKQTPDGQAAAGFATPFEWDVDLLNGYQHQWLENVARQPGLQNFWGCDTPEIADIIANEKFDALLMFGWNKKSFLQGWRAAVKTGTPVFIRLDSQLSSQRSATKRIVQKIAYSIVLPRAADYLSPGQRSDDYLRYFSVPEHRIHRVNHMVDTKRFHDSASAARNASADQELRAQQGAFRDTFVFLFAGKLIDKKRPTLVLQALSKLKGRDVQLWIAGDGPLHAKLKAMVEAEALPVRFLGFVNQSKLPDVYAASDCLVLPSDASETWGLVVNEAFACGLPAIVSVEVGCAPELIDDDKTGWTMNTPDADALAHLLETAIAKARNLPRATLAKKTHEGSYKEGVNRLLKIISTKRRKMSCAARHLVR